MSVSILNRRPSYGKRWKNDFAMWAKPLATLILSLFIFAQSFGQSADLDQGENGPTTASKTPVTWQNGNLGPSGAHFAEGYSIPYRMKIASLVGSGINTVGLAAATEHTLVIEWDTKDQNGHALDYITHYNNMDNPSGSHQGNFGHAAEAINPTFGTAFSGEPVLFQILRPLSTGAEKPDMPGLSFDALPTAARTNFADATKMAIWGGVITGMRYLREDQQDATTASTKTQLEIKFKSNNGSTALIAWGGHIAAEYDWGPGRGASKVNGSPYHMRLISIDGKGGNQDRSLKASAVFVPPVGCMISATVPACEGSTDGLVYTTSAQAGVTNYSWTLDPGTTNAVISGGNTTTTKSGASLTSITIVPASGGFTTGTYTLSLTLTNLGGTGAPCTRSGTIDPAAQADAGGPYVICASDATVTLVGTYGGGATGGTWSGGTATGYGAPITDATAKTVTVVYTPTAAEKTAGSVQFTFTSTGQASTCAAASENTTLTINPVVVTDAGPDQTVCSSSPAVTLAGSVSGGATTGTWSGGGGTFNPNNTTLNATYTPSADEIAAGTVTLTLTSTNPDGPCEATSNDMVITISPRPGTPSAVVLLPLCTDANMKVEVTLPAGLSSSATVTLKQMLGGHNPITVNASTAVGGKLTFAGLTFGKGYSVTILDNQTTVNPAGCTSLAEECGDFTAGYQEEVVGRSQARITDQEIVLKNVQKANVTAAPNPFNDRIRFTLRSEVSGRGSLELYNALGQQVKIVFQGQVTAGQVQTIEYSVPASQRTNLIYLFRVGDQTATGKLIGLNQ